MYGAVAEQYGAVLRCSMVQFYGPSFQERDVSARKDLRSGIMLLCLELLVVVVGRLKVKLVAFWLGEHLLHVAVEVGDDHLSNGI